VVRWAVPAIGGECQMRRRWFAVDLLVLAIATVTVACGSGNTSSSSSSSAIDTNATVKMRMQGDNSSFDAHIHFQSGQIGYIEPLYDSLLSAKPDGSYA